MSGRQPTFYLSHLGGPIFWMPPPPGFPTDTVDEAREYFAGLVASLPSPPRAFLVVSAHWEARRTTVHIGQNPPMLFDYYGFPEHTYRLNYPAPGAPDLARRVLSLLAGAGIPADTEAKRGFDHGVFVPFLIIDSDAQIPVLMLSLRDDLDPEFHLALGRVLAPLRDEGVVIVGSGMSYHNLREIFNGRSTESQMFDRWLTAAVTSNDPRERDKALAHWEAAPAARSCHPRAEHLLPLMVAAGAAGSDAGRLCFHSVMAGKSVSSYQFGGLPALSPG